MNPIAILFTLLLAAASTFASLPLPDGYRVTKVIPVPKEYQLDQVKGNPNVPLMNASIERGKMHMPFWVHIYIRGTNWPGLEEKTVRDLSRHAVVDKWKFETDGDGFYLDYRKPYDAECVQPSKFNVPTGIYGREGFEASIIISNGVRTTSISMAALFPRKTDWRVGKMFNDDCPFH